MSEALIGSKSKFYNQVVVPGATAESADNFQHVSVQEITGFRAALDTVIHGVFASGAPAAIEAGSIQKLIKVTAHGRIRGDIMKMTSGNSIDHEVAIIGIEDANYFYIATPMDIAVADTIQFYRHVTPSYTDTGALNVVTSTAAQTGSFAEDLTVTTIAETFTAPLGAFKCLVYADDTNTVNIRVKMGAAATTTSGLQLQAGRSESFDGGSNVSYCTESGTGKINIHWFTR